MRVQLIFISMCCFLLGCGSTLSQESDEQDNLKPISVADLEKIYPIVKRSTKIIMMKNDLLPKISKEGRGENFLRNMCTSLVDELGLSLKDAAIEYNQAFLIDISSLIIKWETIFELTHAERRRWAQPLMLAESELIKNASRQSRDFDYEFYDDYSRIDRKFAELYRRIGNTAIARIDTEDDEGCGSGGGVLVTLQTSPANGQLVMISELGYEVCKLDNDPSDLRNCKGWRVAPTGEPIAVSGVYYVQGEWAGIKQEPEKHDWNTVKEGEVKTIVKRIRN